MAREGGLLTLIPETTLAAAVSGTAFVTNPVRGIKALLVEANFVRAGGGTTCKVWIQTRVKDETWRDIMSLAFTTTSAKKWSKVSVYAALTAAQGVSDAALSDDTILDGFLGDEVRAKLTTTGTYTGASTIEVTASAQY